MAKQRDRKSRAVFDRRPPQNVDAERSVLGAMLLNPEAVGTVIELLHEQSSEVFYLEAHQHIYDAAVELFRKNIPVDEVTLVEQLARADKLETVGGASYVADLTGAVPTSANVEYYAQIVLDTSVLRRLITICTVIAGEAYEAQAEVKELLDSAEADIFQIAQTRQTQQIHEIGKLVEGGVKQIENLIKSQSGITGLATGFTDLDEKLSGLQPSDMVILAARPSVGKTAFALNIARHAAVKNKKGVLLFSLEMSKEQLTQRLLCMEGQIDSDKLRKGFLAHREFPKLQHAAGVLTTAPIYIDDTAGCSILDLRSKARRWKSQHPVDLLVIDYLQLMTGSRRAENRQVEISEISRSIKGLARELSIPVLALSQLSREAERDDTGMPKLSHLRESGAIEQDADVVLMLSRPPTHEQEEAPNLIKLAIAKQRNGPTGNVDLLFDRNIQRFRNLQDGRTATDVPPEVQGGYEPEDVAFDDDDEVPF